MAVTASVDQVHGVADFPLPGDKVDLMVALNGTETLLLQNVSVIAVGQSSNANVVTGALPGSPPRPRRPGIPVASTHSPSPPRMPHG